MRFENYQKACGIWEENIPARFEKLEPRKYQEDAIKALLENNRIVILSGESGVGKSYLLSAKANELLYRRWYQNALEQYSLSSQFVEEAKEDVIYTTFFDFELALRTAMTNGTMEKLFREFIKPKTLIVDEIGRGKWSDFTATFFQNLLIRRYGDKKETDLGTNLLGKEFVEMFDDALLRRFSDGKFVVIEK